MRKQKNNKVQAARAWARTVTDGLEKPIDPGILDTVAAFRALGFTTTMSCEGHVGWGTGGPYVDLEHPTAATLMHEFIRFRALPPRAKKALQRRERLNMRYAERVLVLLDLFYKSRTCATENRLVLKLSQDVRLQNQGAEINSYRPKAAQKKHIAAYQKEFRAFTLFLLSRV